MKIVAKTDIGIKRKQNQDCYAAGEFPSGIGWAVVCDGMGGPAGGAVAGQIAVQVISEKITTMFHEGFFDKTAKNILPAILENANTSVFEKAAHNEELTGMGTTAVAVIVNGSEVSIAHVGDSRVYAYNGTDGLRQITVDHSVVQQMIDRGEITPEEARVHPDRNLITRALGVSERVIVDFNSFSMAQNEILIICTDGLSGYVDEEEMASLLQEDDFSSLAQRLVSKAIANGGGDNVTVVAIAQ